MVKIIQMAAAVVALAALPGVAQAGTASATNTATFTVASQCSVQGRTVNLGTFTSNQTLGDVGRVLGYYRGVINNVGGYYQLTGFTVGTKGYDYAEWGSVTCTNGVPYTLFIKGTNSNGYIRFPGNGYDILFLPMVKSVNGLVLSDSTAEYPLQGRTVSITGLSYAGQGIEQVFRGGAYMFYYADSNERLGAGAKVDALSYTLNF